MTWELHFGGRDGGHSLGVLRLLVSFPKHVKRPEEKAVLFKLRLRNATSSASPLSFRLEFLRVFFDCLQFSMGFS